jgi:septal ring factor EnvC (AmiA/AmiB activator)
MEEQGERADRSHVKAVIVVVFLVFLVGVFVGYYIWGYRKQQHPDYKDMLKQTISYISTLEEKNEKMTATIGTLENDVSSLKKQLAAPEGDQQARISERLTALEKENTDLQALKAQQEALELENQQLRQRVQTLVEQLNASGQPGTASPQQGPGGMPPGASGY